MSINAEWLESFSNIDTEDKLSSMAAKVAVQNFEFRYAALLLFNSTLYYGVDLFLHKFNYSIIVNKGLINTRVVKRVRQYVIFGTDIACLEKFIETLGESEMKNTGKFIIICQSKNLSDCDETEITKLLWAFKIVNVVIIKPEKEEAVGYTYFPISEGYCNNVKPIKVTASIHGQFLTTNRGNIYGMKLKNLHLCPLIVSTFIQIPYMNITNGTPTGADGELLQILAYGLNASLTVMTPHRGDGWGFRLKNRTWMGSLADVYEDLANFSMTSAAISLSRFSDFQLSRSYYVSHVVWITHGATLQNEALKLLRPFASSTQKALVVSFVFVVLCALIVRTKKWRSIYYPNIQDLEYSSSLVFYSWMICMGQAVLKVPTKATFLQIVILWICYCFIIRTAYQVYLISSLKGTFYEDQFKSIDDAIKANYPFGSGVALKDFYIENPDVYNNWTSVDPDDMIPTFFNLSKGKKFVLAMNKDTVKMLMKINKIRLHILPQDIVCTPSVLYFKKYSPLSESINHILSRMVTAGFPEKFHKKYTTINLRSVNTDGEEPLQIIHFTACYAVLATGWILSLVIFAFEFYFGRIYKHPKISP